MLEYLGISGVHTHSLRLQCASEALDASPRELANISRTAGTAQPYRAERRDDPAIILAAATPDALRELIRADHWARPVPRQAAP
jgi:hypothetical protein